MTPKQARVVLTLIAVAIVLLIVEQALTIVKLVERL